MSTAIERKNRVTALIGTLAVHALLFFLFIWIVFKTPNPPFPESGGSGIEINFGDLTEGTGNTEESGMTINENQEKTEPLNVQQTSQTEDNAVVTSNVENTITINKNEKPTKIESNTIVTDKIEKPVEQKASTELLNALNALKNKKSNTSSGGDGNSGKAGNEGDPNGSKNSDGDGGSGGNGKGGNGIGKGNGNGPGNRYDLKGRNMTRPPQIVDDSQDQGNVVVEIIVDEMGKVIKATPGARGSTTTSAILYAKARQAALSAKFNASPTGITEQRGTITFVFLLN